MPKLRSNELRKMNREIATSVVEGKPVPIHTTVVNNEVVAIRFIHKMPMEVEISYDGYLLYDIEQELFAGSILGWHYRVKDILTMEDVSVTDKWAVPQFHSPSVLHTLNGGAEVLFVPCSSYEVAGNNKEILVYQEFDWKRPIVLKSRSGVLPLME